MKLYSVYTDSHRILKDEWFLKTLPEEWDLNIMHVEGKGGRVGSQEFLNIIEKKLEYIVKSIKDNMDDTIIWSDVDIQFFDRCKDTILESISRKDMVFQREWMGKDVANIGFIAIKCNRKTLNFWKCILERRKDTIQRFRYKKLSYGDQSMINEALHDNNLGIKWGFFPDKIWAKSCGGEPPIDIILHHANCVGRIDRKLKQLKEVRGIVESPLRKRLAGYKRGTKKFVKSLLQEHVL